jgi:hypothetical protein
MNDLPTSTFMEDVGETIGYAEAIIDRKVKLAKLNATEQIAQLTSTIATGLILFGFLFIVLCMFSLATGFALAEHLEWSYATSFFAMTGFYIVIAGVLYALRHRLFTNPVIEVVLNKIYKSNNS